MEGKIDLSARMQVTNKLRDAYGRASKADKGRILDEVQAATGVARSTARRLLSGPRLPDPAEQVDTDDAEDDARNASSLLGQWATGAKGRGHRPHLRVRAQSS